MARRNDKRGFSAKRFLLLAAGLGLTAYFAHHTVYGRYGLSAHAQLTREARSLEAQIAALEAHRDHLATDVKNLQDPPHPDLIEEGARRLLGYEKRATLLLNGPKFQGDSNLSVQAGPTALPPLATTPPTALVNAQRSRVTMVGKGE